MTAPEVFDQDDDGIVVLVNDASDVDGRDDDLRSAAHACPARVITLR